MVAQADGRRRELPPGRDGQLGLGYAQLAAANPRIILCSISGFGQTGPYVHRAGHDIGYLAVAGVLAMGGEHDGAPMMPVRPDRRPRRRRAVGRHRDPRRAGRPPPHRQGRPARHLDDRGRARPARRRARATSTAACAPRAAWRRLNGGFACYGIYRTTGQPLPSRSARSSPSSGSRSTRASAGGRTCPSCSPPTRPRSAPSSPRSSPPDRRRVDRDPRPARLLRRAGHRARRAPRPSAAPRARGVLHHRRRTRRRPIQQTRTPLGTPDAPRPPPRHGEHTARSSPSTGSPTPTSHRSADLARRIHHAVGCVGVRPRAAVLRQRVAQIRVARSGRFAMRPAPVIEWRSAAVIGRVRTRCPFPGGTRCAT